MDTPLQQLFKDIIQNRGNVAELVPLLEKIRDFESQINGSGIEPCQDDNNQLDNTVFKLTQLGQESTNQLETFLILDASFSMTAGKRPSILTRVLQEMDPNTKMVPFGEPASMSIRRDEFSDHRARRPEFVNVGTLRDSLGQNPEAVARSLFTSSTSTDAIAPHIKKLISPLGDKPVSLIITSDGDFDSNLSFQRDMNKIVNELKNLQSICIIFINATDTTVNNVNRAVAHILKNDATKMIAFNYMNVNDISMIEECRAMLETNTSSAPAIPGFVSYGQIDFDGVLCVLNVKEDIARDANKCSNALMNNPRIRDALIELMLHYAKVDPTLLDHGLYETLHSALKSISQSYRDQMANLCSGANAQHLQNFNNASKKVMSSKDLVIAFYLLICSEKSCAFENSMTEDQSKVLLNGTISQIAKIMEDLFRYPKTKQIKDVQVTDIQNIGFMIPKKQLCEQLGLEYELMIEYSIRFILFGWGYPLQLKGSAKQFNIVTAILTCDRYIFDDLREMCDHFCKSEELMRSGLIDSEGNLNQIIFEPATAAKLHELFRILTIRGIVYDNCELKNAIDFIENIWKANTLHKAIQKIITKRDYSCKTQVPSADSRPEISHHLPDYMVAICTSKASGKINGWIDPLPNIPDLLYIFGKISPKFLYLLLKKYSYAQLQSLQRNRKLAYYADEPLNATHLKILQQNSAFLNLYEVLNAKYGGYLDSDELGSDHTHISDKTHRIIARVTFDEWERISEILFTQLLKWIIDDAIGNKDHISTLRESRNAEIERLIHENTQSIARTYNTTTNVLNAEHIGSMLQHMYNTCAEFKKMYHLASSKSNLPKQHRYQNVIHIIEKIEQEIINGGNPMNVATLKKILGIEDEAILEQSDVSTLVESIQEELKSNLTEVRAPMPIQEGQEPDCCMCLEPTDHQHRVPLGCRSGILCKTCLQNTASTICDAYKDGGFYDEDYGYVPVSRSPLLKCPLCRSHRMLDLMLQLPLSLEERLIIATVRDEDEDEDEDE